MTLAELYALTPFLILSGGIVLFLLFIAFNRSHRWAYSLTSLLLGVSLFAMIAYYGDLEANIEIQEVFVIDRVGLLFSGLILLSCMVVSTLAFNFWEDYAGSNSDESDLPSEQLTERLSEFYLLLLLVALGASLLVYSSHFVSFFICLELMNVAMYVLVAYPVTLSRRVENTEASLEAGVKYLVMSAVASATLLFGVALVFSAFGTLSFDAMANLQAVDDQFASAGMVLIIVAIAFKLSLVPFHMWAPDVYQGSPTPVTAIIATVSKGAIFAFLLRYFDAINYLNFTVITHSLMLMALLSMFVGNWLALLQEDIKRLLAYSSIAHVGYLLVALLTLGMESSGMAIEAVCYYVVAYFITVLGAFAVLNALSSQSVKLHDIEGLVWRQPILAVVFIGMILSLAGIPLTVGFIGKFYLFAAGVSGELWILLMALIAGSAIGLFYYLRMILLMIKTDFSIAPGQSEVLAVPVTSGLVLVGLTLLLVGLGVYPQPLINLVQQL